MYGRVGDPDDEFASGSTGTTKEESYEPPTPILSSPIWPNHA
jgi:hypothetical protein